MPLNQGGRQEEKLSSPTPPWIELPNDITSNILRRLGAVVILETAQKVCTTWRGVCKDPAMWRIIDMHTDDVGPINMPNRLVEMCRHAVDRSQGQLVDITLEYFASDELLDYIATSSGSLRRLKLRHCYRLSNGAQIEAIKRFRNLESFNVTAGKYFSTKMIEMIGRSCPSLTSFASNQRATNKQAFTIARSIPELRYLQMLDNVLTNKGLEAILDGCPHLESLDLSRSKSLKLEGSPLEKRLSSQIKFLTYSKCPFTYYPSDSSDDEFDMSESSDTHSSDDEFNMSESYEIRHIEI